MKFKYKISGTGSYLPGEGIENSKFAEIVDTSDEWISSRTGIKSRHFAGEEYTWQMGVKAAKQALEKSDLNSLEIDLIIVSTLTADYSTPSTACILQSELGAKNAFCFDLNAACTGFVQSFDIAIRYLNSSNINNALVVSTESLSKLVDFSDRGVCVLFGDGAGAVVISKDKKESSCYESFFGADGDLGGAIVGEALQPVKHPFMTGNIDKSNVRYSDSNGTNVIMHGQEVYRFATTHLPLAVNKVIESGEIDKDEIDLIIPHQANDRILQSAAKRLEIPMRKMVSHLSDIGNTSSASIPISLNREVEKGNIKRGDKIIFAGFGGGLTYGAVLCEY